MNTKEVLKQAEELRIFRDFAGNHLTREGAVLSTARNCQPPEPDIQCAIGGKEYFFELGEITDRGLAASVNRSLRTGEITGCAFSQDVPILYILRSKANKQYRTDNCPVDLLLHYTKQYPYEPLVLQTFKSVEIAETLADSNFPFERVWIYNDWTKEVVLRINSRSGFSFVSAN